MKEILQALPPHPLMAEIKQLRVQPLHQQRSFRCCRQSNRNATLYALAENDEGCKEMRSGGCQCGNLRYESEGEPSQLYVCHCRECRRQSASAFGLSLIVPRTGLRVTQGEPKFWTRPTDSGGRTKCAFCPSCGSRLWHDHEGESDTLSIKGGSLDNPPDISTAIHIWTSRKLPGVDIPDGLQQFPAEPE